MHREMTTDGNRVVFNTKQMEIGKPYCYKFMDVDFIAIKDNTGAIDIYQIRDIPLLGRLIVWFKNLLSGNKEV
jgi:hypothetical protein